MEGRLEGHSGLLENREDLCGYRYEGPEVEGLSLTFTDTAMNQALCEALGVGREMRLEGCTYAQTHTCMCMRAHMVDLCMSENGGPAVVWVPPCLGSS